MPKEVFLTLSDKLFSQMGKSKTGIIKAVPVDDEEKPLHPVEHLLRYGHGGGTPPRDVQGWATYLRGIPGHIHHCASLLGIPQGYTTRV